MRRSVKDARRGTMKSYIADPVLIVDRDLNVTYMNQSCRDLIGCRKEEALGTMTCRDLFQEDVCEAIDHCIETGEPVENKRVMVRDRRGRRIPLVTHAAPLKRSKDRILVLLKALAHG